LVRRVRRGQPATCRRRPSPLALSFFIFGGPFSPAIIIEPGEPTFFIVCRPSTTSDCGRDRNQPTRNTRARYRLQYGTAPIYRNHGTTENTTSLLRTGHVSQCQSSRSQSQAVAWWAHRMGIHIESAPSHRTRYFGLLRLPGGGRSRMTEEERWPPAGAVGNRTSVWPG
jgi:hypothetical protein